MKRSLLSLLLMLFANVMFAQVSSVQICDSVAWQNDYTRVILEPWGFKTVPFDVIQEGMFVQLRGAIRFTDNDGNELEIDWDSNVSGYYHHDWASWGDGWAEWGTTDNAWVLKFKKSSNLSDPMQYTFDRGAYYVWWNPDTQQLHVIFLSELEFDEPVVPKTPDVKTITLHGNIAEITDLSKAMDDKAFTVGDVSNEKLKEGVFVQVFGDYWFTDSNDFPIYPSFSSIDDFSWATWGDGSLARYDGLTYETNIKTVYKPAITVEQTKIKGPKEPKAVYLKYDPDKNILEEMTLSTKLATVGDHTKPNMHGEIALITDLSKAMDNCFTIGDITYEQLCEGVFLQVRGKYWLADTDGNPLDTRNSKYSDYDWATWGDGSLAKYHTASACTRTVVASDSKVTSGGGTKYAAYFKFDPATNELTEITLRNYLGKYDWHDFSLEGYARTLDGTDPITGYYDIHKAFMSDSLAYYFYDHNRTAEFANIPLFFFENPYQVDGPCRLMYKGKPWPLKLVSVDKAGENEVERWGCEPGTEYYWTYTTDEKGDTINLQAGVYIFYLNFYDQEDEPLELAILRCDLGRYGQNDEDELSPAEPYETETDPTPVIEAGTEIKLASYYTYEHKEAKWKTTWKHTHVGNIETRTKYYVYHTRYSGTTTSYPTDGLAEKLGYPDCVAIIYRDFQQSTYENRKNYANLYYNGKTFAISAERGKGMPVVIFSPRNEHIIVEYLSSEEYQETLTAVRNVASDKVDKVLYDLNGRQTENISHGIYINNGKKILVK